jgi:hypothetical protein
MILLDFKSAFCANIFIGSIWHRADKKKSDKKAFMLKFVLKGIIYLTMEAPL